MKKLLFGILLGLPSMLLAQDCAPFTASAGGKPVKVTVYTDTDQCFTLSEASGVINPSPSRRVVFFMNYGTVKAKAKLSNGIELTKNIMVTNEAVASYVYELVHNEKKDEWDLKVRLGQSDVTETEKANQQAKHDQMVADQKAAQEARDKEWDDKRAAEKAQREKEAAESQPKYTIQKVNTDVNTDIQKVDTHVNTDIKKVDTNLSSSPSSSGSSNSGSSSSNSGNGGGSATAPSTNGGGTTISKGSNTYEIQVLCNNTPITNTYVSIAVKDYNLGTCLTDKEGYCKMMTNETICGFAIDLKGERTGGSSGENTSTNSSLKWSIDGYFIPNCQGGTTFKLEDAAKSMSEMSGMGIDMFLSSWGCK